MIRVQSQQARTQPCRTSKKKDAHWNTYKSMEHLCIQNGLNSSVSSNKQKCASALHIRHLARKKLRFSRQREKLCCRVCESDGICGSRTNSEERRGQTAPCAQRVRPPSSARNTNSRDTFPEFGMTDYSNVSTRKEELFSEECTREYISWK